MRVVCEKATVSADRSRSSHSPAASFAAAYLPIMSLRAPCSLCAETANDFGYILQTTSDFSCFDHLTQEQISDIDSRLFSCKKILSRAVIFPSVISSLTKGKPRNGRSMY